MCCNQASTECVVCCNQASTECVVCCNQASIECVEQELSSGLNPLELQHSLAWGIERVLLPVAIGGQLLWLIAWPLMVTTHYPHGMHLKKAFLEKRHARFVVDGGLLFASLYCTGWGLILCAIGVIMSSGFQFCLLTGSICAVGQVLAAAAARSAD